MSLTELITQKLIDKSRPFFLEIGCNSLRRLSLAQIPNQLNPQAAVLCETGSFLQKDDETWVLNREEVVNALQSFFPPSRFYEQYVSLVLPDHLFSFGSFSVPTVAVKSGIQPLLERELRQSGSLNFNDYMIRYELGARAGNKLTLFFCAISKQIINDIGEVCAQARVLPVNIQPAFPGIVQLIRNLKNPVPHPLAAVNIEENATTACILKNGYLQQIQIIETGMADFQARLCEDLGISDEDAAKTLREKLILLEDPSAEAQLEIPEYTILESVFAELLQKIYGFLLLYSNDHPDETGFSRIIISGAGCKIRNLPRLVSSNLGIAANLLSEEEISNPVVFSADDHDLGSLASLTGQALARPYLSEKFERIFAA